MTVIALLKQLCLAFNIWMRFMVEAQDGRFYNWKVLYHIQQIYHYNVSLQEKQRRKSIPLPLIRSWKTTEHSFHRQTSVLETFSFSCRLSMNLKTVADGIIAGSWTHVRRLTQEKVIWYSSFNQTFWRNGLLLYEGEEIDLALGRCFKKRFVSNRNFFHAKSMQDPR